WELEDLSFRYLEPEVYQRIAHMLDERRVERQQYIARTIATLARELEEVGVKAEITGRPKHIYSIWNKMRSKSLDFSEVHDVRAVRIIVPSVKDCYSALGVVHNLWQPMPWLRELLAGRDEVADWRENTKQARLDETVYVLTPQGKVIDLPAGSTPLDFAYALHTDLGHRCRGAKVDGHIVTLDTPLASGQRVEIVAAKSGGPSRDWLSTERGFVKSPRARQKIRQWFNAKAMADTIAAGRAAVEKELRRGGAAQASLEGLASRLGFGKPDDLFAAVARDEINLRQLQTVLRGADTAVVEPESRK